MLLPDWETSPVWPDATGRALLRAALAEDADFPASWARAREEFSVETATLGHQRLLPLIYQRMVDAGMDDPWRERFKGVYRNAWVVNQRVFRLAREAATILDQAGVPFLAVKGLALAHACYQNPTHRPMEDADFLVRESDAGRAIAAFLHAGWRTVGGGRWWDTLHQVRHSVDLTPDGVTHLDLHWHYMYGAVCQEYEKRLWYDSVPHWFLGRTWQVPSAEDQFVHALNHGMSHNPVATLRWAVDAARLFQGSPTFQWANVVTCSQHLRLVVAVRETMSYLRHELEQAVPVQWYDTMASLPVAARDQAAFDFWAGAQRHCSPIRTFKEEFRRATRLVPWWQGRRRWLMWRGLIMMQSGEDRLVPALWAHVRWRIRTIWKLSASRILWKRAGQSVRPLRRAIERWVTKKRRDLSRKRERYARRLRRWRVQL